MKKYVLGFAYSENAESIVLIEKDRPDWQAGKLNGVGGKIEDDDLNEVMAMVREFKEETGIDTSSTEWDCFGEMIFNNDIMGGGAKVFLYRLFDNKILNCETQESEKVLILDTKTCLDIPHVPNLSTLIPLSLNLGFSYTTLIDG